MSMFGSGPRSNILETVAPMYQGIVNAEKQKGEAMRTAMGAFGQAIDPKTIGMNKFKKEFANADWSKPETFMRAGQQLMQTDPNAALGFIQKGQAMMAAMAPKASEYVTATRFEDGVEISGSMEKGTGAFKSFGGTGAPAATGTAPKTTATVTQLEQMGADVSGLDPNGRYAYNIVGNTVNVLGLQTGSGYVADPTKEQWSGLDLQNEGFEVEDVTATYDVELSTSGKPTIIGKVSGTGTAEADKPTATSQMITEAYGYAAGSPEHQDEMQNIIKKRNTVENISSPMEQIRIVKGDVEKNKRYQDMTATAAMIDDGHALLPSVKKGNAKAAVILERIGSQLSTSGVRAVSEIQRYTESGSWSQRMSDWINRGFKGVPSDISIEETEKLLNLLDNQNDIRMNLFLDHQAEVFSPAMTGDNRGLLNNTINAFRPEPNQAGAVVSVTEGMVPIPNAPSGLKDGIHSDAKGNKIRVIKGVAYEF